MPSNANSEVAAPYFDIELLKTKGEPTEKEKQEARVLKRIGHYKRDIKNYENNIRTVEANLDRFLLEVQNCFAADQVERILVNNGV